MELADGKDNPIPNSYRVLECFPTSAWRSSGLRPLPAKSKNPPLAGYRDSLCAAYGFPKFDIDSHDDLQAVVAALCAVGAIGGPVLPVPQGVTGRVIATGRIEGLIWDVTPSVGVVSHPIPLPSEKVASTLREPVGVSAQASVYVTSGVLAQVNRMGASQMQIALRGFPSASKRHRLRVRLIVESEDYILVLGDSHAAWRSHQDSASVESFDQLFAIAADTPGQPLPVSQFEVLGTD